MSASTRPQHGDGCLQPVLEAGERPPVAAQLVLERPPPQGQQLGTDLPVLALEHPVLLRGCGLALQVLELLADLVPQVAQAGEVLPRLRDPALGLAATLLVLRDSRGLLQIDPEVLRPGLDESGDHPLLDDRVAAGAQTRTQEQVGDVAAAAAHAVEEVARLPVPGNLALHRDLPVLGVLAAGAASALSKMSSMVAVPTGLRPVEPLKMTSAMDSPRKVFADISPMTQRTASITLDLPQPFGPTTPTRCSETAPSWGPRTT